MGKCKRGRGGRWGEEEGQEERKWMQECNDYWLTIIFVKITLLVHWISFTSEIRHMNIEKQNRFTQLVKISK